MSGPAIVTVFRNRLRDPAPGYPDELAAMRAAAAAMPGLVEVKTFVAEDGERATLVTFASRAEHDAWRDHAGHRVAQARGRAEFYDAYRVQVCELVEERSFERRRAPGPPQGPGDDGGGGGGI